jgi:molybdenum cofactor cytidylyltransferase
LTLAVVLLAAGGSRRMRGRDKLLEEICGQPLLRRMAERALSAEAGPVAVTLPPGDEARGEALAGLSVTRLPVPDAAEGMAASLRTAACWADRVGAEGLMVLLADMPELTTSDLRALAAAFAPDGPPLRATSAIGIPGHPVVFPSDLFRELETLTGDTGARDVLRLHPPRLLALPATHATTDLDTPEAWDAWHAARRGKAGD